MKKGKRKKEKKKALKLPSQWAELDRASYFSVN
jgi:hypothetical protein